MIKDNQGEKNEVQDNGKTNTKDGEKDVKTRRYNVNSACGNLRFCIIPSSRSIYFGIKSKNVNDEPLYAQCIICGGEGIIG